MVKMLTRLLLIHSYSLELGHLRATDVMDGVMYVHMDGCMDG